jgi:hypothetical protein
MSRKTNFSIVCKIVDVPVHFVYNNTDGIAHMWQQVHESVWKVDCVRWIERQHKNGDKTAYRIFTSHMDDDIYLP